MFQIKDFNSFAKSINEGLFDASNVWKFDPETPQGGDLAKFSFKAKVQHREGSGDQEIGNVVADFISQKLSTESRFIEQLKLGDRIPVMYTDRNTEGGVMTGGRGVVTGNIIFIGRKFYDNAKLNTLEAFKPKGATNGVVVNGFKIYDEVTLDTAKKGSPNQPADPNKPVDPNAPVDPNKPVDPNAPVDPNKKGTGLIDPPDQTTKIINNIMGFKFGSKSDMIKWVNAAMTLVDPTLKDVLIKNGVINDTYNNEMAAAIQKIVGDSAPVTKITEEIAKAIKAKIDTVTVEQVQAVIAASTQGGAGGAVGSEIATIQNYIVGLKLKDKNLKVGILQTALSAMSPDAAKEIAAKGGIDNNYGGATANALKIALGEAAPVNEVTPEIAKKLIEKASKLTPEQIKSIIDYINKALSGQVPPASGGSGRKKPKDGSGGSSNKGGISSRNGW